MEEKNELWLQNNYNFSNSFCQYRLVVNLFKFFINFIKKVLQNIISYANIICELNLRSWRNRQTRTFEGRMGDRMGSSPIDRTKKTSRKTCFLLFRYSVIW